MRKPWTCHWVTLNDRLEERHLKKSIIALEKLQSKYYSARMSLRMSSEVKKFFKAFASEGGKARAAKYDHSTLSEWSKRGGRPRKAKAEEAKRTNR
jgi:hypothetical protein